MTPQRFRIANYMQQNPPNGKRVTRPSRWGNPFRIGHDALDAAQAVEMFRGYLKQQPGLVELAQRELRGFDLGCTCPLDQPCHADVWIELANKGQNVLAEAGTGFSASLAMSDVVRNVRTLSGWA